MDVLARPGHSGRHGSPAIRSALDAAAARRAPPRPAGGRRAASRCTSERPGNRPGPSPPAGPRDQRPGPPALPSQPAIAGPGASAATRQRKDHRAEAGPRTRHTPFVAIPSLRPRRSRSRPEAYGAAPLGIWGGDSPERGGIIGPDPLDVSPGNSSSLERFPAGSPAPPLFRLT